MIAAQQITSSTQSNTGERSASLGEIGNFALKVKLGASYVASYTMYWSPVNGATLWMPAYGYPGETPPMKWSGNICVNKTGVKKCSDFALANAPLNHGDTVWMIVSVHGGRHFDTGFNFTFADTQKTAHITADGGTVSASFTFDGIE